MSIAPAVSATAFPAFAPGPVSAPATQGPVFNPSFWAQRDVCAPTVTLQAPQLGTRQTTATCVGPNTPATCPASEAWCAFASCASKTILVGNGACPDADVVAACADKFGCDAYTNLLVDNGDGATCLQDFANLQSCCTGNNAGGGSSGGSTSSAAIGLSFNSKLLIAATLLAGAVVVANA